VSCWRRLGRVGADGSHARVGPASAGMLPTPVVLSPGAIRVYLGILDAGTVSRVTFVDVDARDPTRVLDAAAHPALDLGTPGMFDDNGVSPGCVLAVGAELWLYYLGYQLGRRARFSIFTGLAVSRDCGETFERAQRVPVLDRTDLDMFFRSTPCVLREGSRFRVWYAGGGRWLAPGGDGKALAVSEIRHSDSGDGRRWRQPEDTCVTVEQAGAGHALVRPWVRRVGDGYELAYCVRSSTGYRLAFAASRDGLAFDLVPPPRGLDPVPGGWDEEMSYPAVVEAAGSVYLFYSGNKWGAAGFGVAVLEE
jgi:predicted GH43/DUF377 family glycosyl hydrolase